MEEDTYTIAIERSPVAKEVPLEMAAIFTQAIMEHYYNEPNLAVTIQRTRAQNGGRHEVR